jgi:hypothetical protein
MKHRLAQSGNRISSGNALHHHPGEERFRLHLYNRIGRTRLTRNLLLAGPSRAYSPPKTGILAFGERRKPAEHSAGETRTVDETGRQGVQALYFWAQVHHARSVGLDEVVDLIIRQGSTVTRADILGVLEGFETAVVNLLLEGARVNTPLANYRTSVRGVFEEGNLDYDPSRHQVVGAISAGRRLKAALRSRSQVARVKARYAAPTLLLHVDCDSGEQNGAVTPGGMAQVTGDWLKFDPADPAQGVFYVLEDGSETRVPVVGHNKPSKLMYVAPAGLVPGNYTLEVRAGFGEGDVRSGALNATLTV